MEIANTESMDSAEEILKLRKRVEQLERSEKAALERAEILREILDSIPPIITAWRSDGTLVFVNQTFLNQSGFLREDVIGQNFTELHPPQEVEKISKIYNELRDKPDGALFTTSGHGRTKDGEWVFVEGAIMKKSGPPIMGFVGCSANVTDRVMAEVDYKESVEAMGTLFNGVQDGLLIHDRSGRFIQANQRLLEMFGSDLSLFMSNSSESTADQLYCPHDDSLDLLSVWDEVLAGQIRQLEYRIKRRTDGKIFDVEVFMRAIRLKGKDQILVVIKDVTEKKRVTDELHRALALAEQLRLRAEAASETKSKFLANMSHELRTPLNAILGFSELLEGQFYGAINEKQSAYTQAIHESGSHLLQLISDILDIAKVEAGKMEINPSSTDLSQLLENAFIMIKEMAYRGGIQLELDVAPEFCTRHILADDVRLKQIVMNLLSNAVKFTPSGGVIRLEARSSDHELKVSVSDTGIGIKTEDQGRIFEEFEQVDSSFSRQHDGTGLGLSLTRKLVELHGGRIWVESEGENKGSVFTFEIPYVTVGPKEHEEFSQFVVSEPLAGTEAHAPDDNRPSILVVEDNSANMKLTSNLLQLGGYKALTAYTSEEAIAILKTQTPALILMDISLPGMDGLRATQAIKSNPSTSNIPVVALTAHAMKDDEARAMEAGCDAYLVKPIDTRKFYRTIRNILKPLHHYRR